MQSPMPHAAPYVRRLGGKGSYWVLGLLQTFLAEGEETGGRFTMGEGIAHRGSEPPPHTHAREDEAYYILEGRLTFRVGGETIAAGPGDFVWLPRGVEHSFALETERGRALVLYAPAGLEGAFKRLGEPVSGTTLPPPGHPTPAIEEIVRVFGEYGIAFAPPPAG